MQYLSNLQTVISFMGLTFFPEYIPYIYIYTAAYMYIDIKNCVSRKTMIK